MFSVRQKREIADAVQKILRDTEHPELPKGEISFSLHVVSEADWSYATIRNNGSVADPEINPHNEAQDPRPKDEPGPRFGLDPATDSEQRDKPFRVTEKGHCKMDSLDVVTGKCMLALIFKVCPKASPKRGPVRANELPQSCCSEWEEG